MSSWPQSSSLPQPLSTILHKIYPLLLDGSRGVRQQAQKVLQALPRNDVSDHVHEALPYVRAGMTHLAADIRLFCIEILAWLMQLAPQEVVSCAGGWAKTLNCFLALLGWHRQDDSKWSSHRVTFGKASSDGKAQARYLQVLATFLTTGFSDGSAASRTSQDTQLRSFFPRWHADHHAPPTQSNAYGYLNLFASQKENVDDAELLEDHQDRIRVFTDRFLAAVEDGLDSARKDGGEVGRAAGLVTKALKNCRTEDD